MEYYLGRTPSPYDPRDYNLEAFMPKGVLRFTLAREKRWDYPLETLNQEQTFHCVGFSMANFGINSPTNMKYTNEIGHSFYYLCKEEDGEPKAENGSSIRSAAKVLRKVRRINGYAFASTMSVIRWWLLNKGPMITGTIWTQNMFTPDSNGIILPIGDIVGGHAYLLDEVKYINSKEYLGFHNSWGEGWGIKGRGYISFEDFEKILRQFGEVMTAVELPIGFPRR